MIKVRAADGRVELIAARAADAGSITTVEMTDDAVHVLCVQLNNAVRAARAQRNNPVFERDIDPEYEAPRADES